MRLVDVIAAIGPGLALRTAIVTAVTGSTLTITLAGATLTGVPKLGSTTPAVSDVVYVLVTGQQYLIIGSQ